MIDRALCSDDDYIPKKETKPDRSRGGSSSGVPPNFRIATEQEDWERPFVASKEPALRVPPDLVFGIDFVILNGKIVTNSTVQQTLATFIPGKRIAIVNPDKASAFGAALHASVIVGLNAIPLLNDIRPDC